MYLKYGNKKHGAYKAQYFRYRETLLIKYEMYFDDPTSAACWIFRKFVTIQPHCWNGGEFYSMSSGDVIFRINADGNFIFNDSIQDLHSDFLKGR